jgi:hypothetical protein
MPVRVYPLESTPALYQIIDSSLEVQLVRGS